MTVKDVLLSTRATLGCINVPVGLYQQIGEPIAVAIGNLTACIDGLEKLDKPEVKEDGNNADAG